jgi:hypothetical protein
MARRRQNVMVVLAVIGLVAGAMIGYLTRPEIVEMRIGPMNIEVRGSGPARGGEMTSGQVQHVAIVTLIGGLIGLGLGFAVQRGKIKI